MKIIVNAHKCEIDKTPVNEKEINITKCEFEFAEEITDDYVKEAYFTLGKGDTYKQIIVDNECNIPGEVLEEKGDVKIGVVAYLVEDENTIKRYNPSPAYFNTWEGSLRDAENSEPITPSDKEQMEQMLQAGLHEIHEMLTDLQNKVDSGYFNAKINGYNTIEIIAGDNIEIEQEDNILKISATGVSPLPDYRLETSDGNIFKTVDDAYFIVKESD